MLQCHKVALLQREKATSANSKSAPVAELAVGTAIRPSCKRLRKVAEGLKTAADGCRRKRDVERTHPQPPDPQNETGTLATGSGTTSWGMGFLGLGTTVGNREGFGGTQLHNSHRPSGHVKINTGESLGNNGRQRGTIGDKERQLETKGDKASGRQAHHPTPRRTR